MPGNLVLLYQLHKISRSVTSEGGFSEVGIRGEEIRCRRMQIGEVAAAAAGDQYLLADAVGMVKQNNPAAAAAGVDGAEKACCAGAHNHYIVVRSGNLHSTGKS